MIEHVKRKLNKRELLERDGYTKHNKAKPYVRKPLVAQDIRDDIEDEFLWTNEELTESFDD